MKRFARLRFSGLRARLLAIVLLVAVPVTLALVAYASVQNAREQDRARALVQESLADDIRSMQDLVAQGRATLDTFGITFAIQTHRWDLAQGNSVRLRALHPEYEVVAATDADGRIKASSPATGTVDVSGEDFFVRAVSTRALTVSGYRADPITGRPAIIVCLPVYDGSQRLVSVEYIAFDPGEFASRLSTAGESSVSLLIDGSGTVVGRRPILAATIGRTLADVGLVRTVLDSNQGTATVLGLDGAMREYYFGRVFPGGEGGLHEAVGFSPDALFATERRTFQLTLAGFAGFAVLALVVAWMVGTYSIYRPTILLQRAAERIADGDLTARAELGSRHDEIGALRDRFNDMAGSLESHVRDLESTRQDLRLLNAELEERVKRRTADLEAANKELEAFSYSVSHDLRSPLRAIDGFSLALLEDHSSDLDDDGRADLARVRANASRMGELIDGLLRLSRLSRQDLNVRDVDLSAMVREIADELREIEPDRIVIFKIQPDVHGGGDPGLLRVALDNLIGNSWKFTCNRAVATIEFGATERDGDIVYSVRDNGAGFDMAYAGKLFGAFQRVHGQAEFPGTGIGLATAARIVRRHGGRIWAEGRVDEGATFSFTLDGGPDGAVGSTNDRGESEA